jgi:hypothetical protein
LQKLKVKNTIDIALTVYKKGRFFRKNLPFFVHIKDEQFPSFSDRVSSLFILLSIELFPDSRR